MTITILAFLQGIALSMAAVVVERAAGAAAASWLGDVPLFALAFALGLGLRGPAAGPDDDGRVRLLAFGWPARLAFAACALAAAALLPGGGAKDASGPGAAAGAPAWVLAVLAVAGGFAGGRMVHALLLFSAVQKAARLHLVSALLLGGAAGYLAAAGFVVTRGDALLVLGQAFFILLAGSGLMTVRGATMPVAVAEPPRAGLVAHAGVVAAAAGGAALFTLLRARAAALLGDGGGFVVAFDGAVLLFAALGAVALPAASPRLRRAGLLLGSCALFAVVATVAILEALAAAPLQSWLERLGTQPASADDWKSRALAGAFLVGPLALAAGIALPALPRFYGVVPPAKKFVRHQPLHRRRALEGGVLRCGLFVLGAVIGAGAAAEGGVGEFQALLSLALGGMLAASGDPRAGAGRKLLLVGGGGVLALVALLVLG